MAKIAVVYNVWRKPIELIDMAYIRWIKIAEALAKRGHKVEIPTNETRWLKWWKRKFPIHMGPNLKRIPISDVSWSDYDVIKTLFTVGFETLEKYKGDDHPFIISKLGSVVGPREMDGIYFYGEVREELYASQERITEKSKYITVLNRQARDLWIECHGSKDNFLLVPGAVETEIPGPQKNPFPNDGKKVCIFAGNIYNKYSQPEANKVLVDKLNRLGKNLSKHGVRLYMLGPGDVSRLDKEHVTYMGVIPYENSWDYFHFADVGVVVSAGKFMHNNESTKIYYYLRAGLPCVNESGFPNDHVVNEANLGFVVENGNMEVMAEEVAEAARKDWDKDFAINYILESHTWDKRAEIYDNLIKEQLS